MSTLSILIPTYNRSSKLYRLLKNLDSELAASNIGAEVTVLVSDNASSDNTQEMLAGFSTNRFKFKDFRQLENIGFDGNVRFLYDKSDSDYGWFFADDDILLPGAIYKVWKALQEARPDILLFSFIQPPDSKTLTFDFPNSAEIVTAPEAVIELVQRYPKISIYIMRKKVFRPEQIKELEPFLENGFYFLDLAYSVLGASVSPKLVVISEPLAKCDNDYLDFNFVPKVIFEMYKVFTHPFVAQYLPGFAESKRESSYCSGIQFLFAIKTGTMISHNMALYDHTIKKLPVCLGFLIRNPRSFFQLLVMKLGLSAVYPKIRPMVNLLRGKLAGKSVAD